MFNGIHYKWPFSIAMLNYQRVPGSIFTCSSNYHVDHRTIFQLIVGSVDSFIVKSAMSVNPGTPKGPIIFCFDGLTPLTSWVILDALEDVMTFNSILQSCAVAMTLGRAGDRLGKTVLLWMIDRCKKRMWCQKGDVDVRRVVLPEGSPVDAPERVVASRKYPGNGHWPKMCSSRWDSARWLATSSPRQSVWFQHDLPLGKLT